MKNILYASNVGSPMYAQVWYKPDAFAVEVLGRYQSNPGVDPTEELQKR